MTSDHAPTSLTWSALKQRWVKATKRPDSDQAPEDLEWFGLNNLMSAAKAWNRWQRGREVRRRKRRFREEFSVLAEENGPLLGPPLEMRDGWALDESRSLPHLADLLDQAETYIGERGGRPRTKASRGFIQDILDWNDLARFPAFLDFATSSQLLATVCRYLGQIPVLSDTVPPGLRFVESTAAGQLDDGVYRQSQLYHLDFHDRPLVYVIVLLRDVTERSGPFTFFPASVSDRLAGQLGYGRRGSPYRVPDAEVEKHADRAQEEIVLTYPRGTVLFLDSSRCFHFGSRDAVDPRYQMMYAFVSPCRADFAREYLVPKVYPKSGTDSRLRRLILGLDPS
jgi:hypothetical protein